jgi:CheY-like chemotaxis protein
MAQQNNGPVTVAIINTNPDLVRLLRFNLERAGFVVFEIHIEQIRAGTADIAGFLEQHDPRVIVYDVAPPYRENWSFMEHLRNSPGFERRRFVLTSMNVERVHQVVGNDETVYEIVGLEEDLRTIVQAVKEASRARPTR